MWYGVVMHAQIDVQNKYRNKSSRLGHKKWYVYQGCDLERDHIFFVGEDFAYLLVPGRRYVHGRMMDCGYAER